ncbi:cardiolipin synthase [Brevibacillus fulvus]|uniref:Cardiolipin synthase n=1 Tax=Brevibacillus fulvus TaxID=1125967 RepID=A0A939BTE4_9BACL|nr:cardiolipin synthase [Brevibacillus fulvus]MBM7591423.1 cardiolipin synthase [Brevibacillus fulvus]
MVFQQIFTIVSIINLIFAAVLIFLERRNIAATWAWLMVLLFLPGLGFVLYLMLGQNLSKRKIYKIKQEEFSFVQLRVKEQLEQLHTDQLALNDPMMHNYRDLISMHLANDYALYTQDNHLQIFTNGQSKFNQLLASIEGATDHIHLMYYIFRPDELGRKIVDALIRKAQEGVEVRLLYDHIGSLSLSRRFFRPLREAGGQVAAFFPSRIPYLNIRLNFRNHRKLAIIDGKTGFIGGFNVGNEYLGLDKQLGYWRDTHLMLKGSAVHAIQTRFFLDWNLASRSKLEPDLRYFPELDSDGRVGIQIVSSGPNSERHQIHHGYVKMIHDAKKYVYLQTPYFIPDESLLTALRIAALSGIDVKVMFPFKSDNPIVYWASYTYLGELLKDGVKCYFYQKGFLHAKTLVIDDKIATVGTANADIRSFKLNFESNAFIYDSSAATHLAEIFLNDLEDCREMTLEQYRNRPVSALLKESLARLLSPIF